MSDRLLKTGWAVSRTLYGMLPRTAIWLTLALVMAVAPPAWASHETVIVSGPPAITSSSTADFDFDTNASSAIYQCSLDSGPFTNCPDPHQITNVPEGSHTLAVRAVAGGASSHPDPTPATHSWTTDYTPPETTITSGPSGPTAGDPTFEFSSSESVFECAIDGGAFAACSSPHTATGLSDGDHTFRVRAHDAATNADPTPAERSFTVDTVGPTTPPTIEIVPAPARTQSPGRPRGRTRIPSIPGIQTQAAWLVRWDRAEPTESFDISYRKIPTGVHPDSADLEVVALANDVTSKQSAFTAQAGFTYCFQAVANDSVGNGSPAAEACATMPHRAKKLHRPSGWQVKSGSGHYGGGYLRWNGSSGLAPLGKSLRAALIGPVDEVPAVMCEVWSWEEPCPATFVTDDVKYPAWPHLRRIVLVATRCPSCGKVRVSLHGSPAVEGQQLKYPLRFSKTVNLKSSSTQKKQLIVIRTYSNPALPFKGWFLRITPKSGNPRIEGVALPAR